MTQDDGWKSYFEQTRGRRPQRLLVDAINWLDSKGAALDLGSGALNDAGYMLRLGFEHVTALDHKLVAEEIAQRLPPHRFAYVQSTFEDYDFPLSAFDLVTAQYALPFTKPSEFDRVFAAAAAALKPRGILTGQIFGDRDEWADDTEMSFRTAEEARALLDGMDVISFEEEEAEGGTAAGKTKHWHLFHFIARRI